MKKPFVILGLLMLLALSACHPKQDDSIEAHSAAPLLPAPSLELQAIDSLLWQQPDSALALLLPWFDTVDSNETFDNHYAQLLLAELLYKNDYAQTNREELLDAVAYFDSIMQVPEPVEGQSKKQKVFFCARAHYINGAGYYECDSMVKACKEYMKTLEIMEELFEEKELVEEKAKLMAQTYTHLTVLFSDQYMHEQAICFGKEALAYYEKYDATPWHKAWVLNEIGSHYEMMDCYDSAVYYYHKGLAVLPDTNTLIYRDFSTLLAFLSYKKDKTLDFSQNQMRVLLSLSESEKEYLARCLIMGDIYFREKQLDSAYIYFYKVFHRSQSVGARKQVAELLVEICEQQGRNEEAQEYARFLVPFANQNENQGQLKSQLTKTIHDYEQERIEIRHRKQLRKYTKHGGAALIAMASLAAIFVVFFFVHKKRNKHLQSQKEAVNKQLETERHSHKMQQAALSGRLKRSKEALRHTIQQLEEAKFHKNKTVERATKTSDLNAFKSSPVCQHILEVVGNRNFKPKMECIIYKDYALDRNQLKCLVEAADEHLDGFTIRIRKKHPALTEDDMKYCCLYLLGLNEADISALMQRAYSTVCERNRKIKRILGTQSDLTLALMELV